MSTKCPEPNLPLLIEFQEKKLSRQWIDLINPITTHGSSTTFLSTWLPPADTAVKILFIDYIFLYAIIMGIYRAASAR